MQNYLGRKNTCICTKDVYKTPIKKDGEMVNVCDGKKYICIYSMWKARSGLYIILGSLNSFPLGLRQGHLLTSIYFVLFLISLQNLEVYGNVVLMGLYRCLF